MKSYMYIFIYYISLIKLKTLFVSFENETLGPFRLSRLARVKPNWVEFDWSATLARQCFKRRAIFGRAIQHSRFVDANSLWSAELLMKT